MKKVLYTFALLFFTAINMNIYAQANAGPDDWTCGNIYTLQADTTGIDTAQGTWSCEYIGSVFVDVNDPYTDVTIPNDGFGDSSYVEILFIWTVNTDSDTVLITFYEQPAAFAGNDTYACGASISLQAEFSISNATGVWSNLSAPSVAFINNTDPNTEVIVSQYGTYYFTWTEKNAVNPLCSSTDTVVIEFFELPNINAGNDTAVCGLCIDLHAIGSGTGQWQLTPGIIFSDVTDPNTHACSVTYGTVALLWIGYIGPCIVPDTITVTFVQQPDANAFMFMDTINTYSVCGTDFATLQAPDPGIPGANSYWWDEVAGTTFHPVPDTTNATAIIDTGQYGLHTFHWIVSNSGCMDISAGINVYFIEQPAPDAGPRYDTANGNTYALNGLQSIDTSVVTWSSLDPMYIVFASTNWNSYGDTIYDTVMCNLTLPQITDIYLTEDNDGCTTRDTITITFLPFNYIDEYENPDFLQIYPNPYKNFINIKYNLIKTSKVNIDIFDILGKKVQTIVSSIQGKGEYAYTFNAKQIGLQSGTYFVKLKFNNATYVKKILEVK